MPSGISNPLNSLHPTQKLVGVGDVSQWRLDSSSEGGVKFEFKKIKFFTLSSNDFIRNVLHLPMSKNANIGGFNWNKCP